MKDSIGLYNLRRHRKGRTDNFFDHQIGAAYDKSIFNFQSPSCILHALERYIWSAAVGRLTFTYLILYAKNSKLIGPWSTKD